MFDVVIQITPLVIIFRTLCTHHFQTFFVCQSVCHSAGIQHTTYIFSANALNSVRMFSGFECIRYTNYFKSMRAYMGIRRIVLCICSRR